MLGGLGRRPGKRPSVSRHLNDIACRVYRLQPATETASATVTTVDRFRSEHFLLLHRLQYIEVLTTASSMQLFGTTTMLHSVQFH